MIMKRGFLALTATVCMMGCAQLGSSAQPANDYPPIGTDAWYAWVDQTAGVSDGQGHGPDYGSAEWCQAAHWRVFSQRNSAAADCSPEWQETLSQALRKSDKSMGSMPLR